MRDGAGVSSPPIRRAFRVLRPGLRTTVEDLGRRGVARWGIPPGGAFDALALAAANLLVGNPPEAAGLELTLRGPALEAEDDMDVAVVGADLEPSVREGSTEHGVERGRAVRVPRGAVLRCGYAKGGSRAWLAVGGGVDVPPVFGSRATDVASGFGGLEGRPLRAGDLVPVGPPRWSPPEGPAYRDPIDLPPGVLVVLRLLPGPQHDEMPPGFAQAFEQTLWRVGHDSDRTGIRLTRLSGPRLPDGGPTEIEPEGTTLGAIQLPAGGEPIILGVDRPTTGGYPKPAAVIRADFGLLARLSPGGAVRFRFVDREEAGLAETEGRAALEALRR